MDLKRTAREVLENVGGEENIISIMSCFTRVRVELKDKTKVDEKKLKEADGCQGVNWVGNTVQIIFGGRCNDVYDELEKIVHITETEANGEKSIVKKQSVWAVVIDYIANSIQPVVPILIASGFLQSVLAMLNYLDIDTTTYTYQVLNSIGQAGYYFLPIFLAFAAAKKLRINPYLGALVGAVMVYPAIIEAGSAGGTASFLGVPVTLVSYASSITPILISMPVVGGLLIGGAAPYLVLTGVHNGIALPITLSELASQGFSYFFPLLAYGNIAVGGAALGVWFKTKNNRLKTTAMSSCLMAVVGITEPALFGVLLPAKKPLIALGVMGAVCSAVSLMFGVKCTALSMCGLGGLPAFFGDTFVIWCILMAVSFVGAFLITILIGFKDIPEEEA